MKKKMLCFALGAFGATQAVVAQDYDDRWYVNIATGVNVQDSDRDTKNAIHGTIGLGRFFSPAWSVDLELNYQDPEQSANENLRWSQYGAEIVPRWHFRNEARRWGAYLLAGLGAQHAREQFEVLPGMDSSGERQHTNLAVKLGGGALIQYGRANLRAEIAYRFDLDDRSVSAPNETSFDDLIASIGVTVALGSRPSPRIEPKPVAELPPPPPAAPPPPPVEYCPDGSVMQSGGCPVPLTVELRGVDFDFDRADLRPDAMPVLEEAAQLLKQHPQLRVEVSGHTDSIGSASYNQVLSERRARAVYDYLIASGISADRLVGPVGYGEERPIATNETAEGRARNRRIELNVQQ